MKITRIRYYGGAKEKVCRLGLANLFLELQAILLDTRIELEERVEANGAAAIRELLDEGFARPGEWVKQRPVGWIG